MGGRRIALGAARGRVSEPARPGRGIRIGVGAVLTLAALVIAIGSTWTLVQIAEAGSRAVWEGSFSDVPLED